MGLLTTAAIIVPAPEQGMVWRFQGTNSLQVYPTPAAWLGHYITWVGDGAGEVQFGPTTGVPITASQDSGRAGAGSAGDPYVLTANTASGFPFPASERLPFFVHNHHKYFALLMDTATTDVTVSAEG